MKTYRVEVLATTARRFEDGIDYLRQKVDAQVTGARYDYATGRFTLATLHNPEEAELYLTYAFGRTEVVSCRWV